MLQRSTALLLLGSFAVSACEVTVNIGEPLPSPDTPDDTGNGDENVGDRLPEPPHEEAGTYAWKWVNPVGTGVSLRGVWSLPSGEKWFVGDGGTVHHEVGGVFTTMRVGALDEQLVAVWASGADDVWVGGTLGSKGILLHWDGEKWSENFSAIAHAPIRALHGIPGDDIFVVAGDRGLRMTRQGVAVELCLALSVVRDVWVQGPEEIWFVGDDGVARFTTRFSFCEKIADQPTYAVWGDGSRLFMARAQGAQIVERVGDEWRGHAFGVSLWGTHVSGAFGKALVGDASGRIYVLFHTDRETGYTIYDPRPTAPKMLEIVHPSEGERLNGFAVGPAGVSFAGDRGLRGMFEGNVPVTHGTSYRGYLAQGMSAPDGTLFARCGASYGRKQVCRWDEGIGWIVLPGLESYDSYSGVAGSKNALWLGGIFGDERRTEFWDGATWQLGPATRNVASALVAFGPDDVWVSSDSFTLHFDGHAWEARRSYGYGPGVYAADGLRGDDVWMLDQNEMLSHWDGSSLRVVSSLPAGYWGGDGGHARAAFVASADGVWLGATKQSRTPEGASVHYSCLLHFNGKDWVTVDLPGIDAKELSRGPDGKIHMLGTPTSQGIGGPVGSVHKATIYTVDDGGIRLELEVPDGVLLSDLAAVGPHLYALGAAGATLRLEKTDTTGGTR